ncbi:PREDICTED: upstream activation factor subunit spp27 [Wasmannia auropunctata]|uniref:upstream activation factor subunit spp27 n=1 Tax=Wasmannia auropunctata TaxID=64793 RepID=UPI0005EE1FA6|nr:PREDICTED: upstream activation factor subunit spp27 [Wasmannia auropunctata]
MADISKDELRKEITAILKDADLTTMSAKKVRQQIEEKLDIDLIERKKEVDDLVMECLQEKQDGGKKKKKAASEESEDGEEEEEEGSEEEEEEEEKKPAKRNPAKKAPNKRKKGSSDDEESASDDDASDEEYSPKKPKVTPKKSKPGKKGKKKGSDSDSDEDWGKNKKAPGSTAKKGGGGGGKGKGGGYTRAITLSPELAAVVGAEQMARHEVVKKVWSIIKERNLYDPKNKQFAICDEELMKVIGVKRFRTFGMMKYLKNHFVD